MAVNLSPVGGVAAQFFDNSGNVLTGGKLYSYAAGTTTPAATYTSSNGGTPWSNPIILDAAGRVSGSGEIWLTDSIAYKFVLKDSNDVLIATYDSITGINSNFVNFVSAEETQTATQGQTLFTLTTMSYQPGTDNLLVFINGSKQISGTNYTETSDTEVTFLDGLNVGDVVDFITATPINTLTADAATTAYTPPFVDSVTTNVEDKLAQTVSVKDFGAVGDGVADDAAAIQAAIDGYTAIYFPAGTYKIGTTLNITDDTYLFGDGDASIISADDGVGAISALSSGSGTQLSNIKISKLKLLGQSVSGGFSEYIHLLSLIGVQQVVVSECTFEGFQGDGIYIGSTGGRGNSTVKISKCYFNGVNYENRNCISVISCEDIIIDGCTFENATKSTMPGLVDFEPNGSTDVIKNVRVTNNYFGSSQGSVGLCNFVLGNLGATPSVDPHNIVLSNNNFNNDSLTAIIFYINYIYTTPLNLVVSNNTFRCARVGEFRPQINNTTISNNTIYQSNELELGFSATDTATNVNVIGNTFYGTNNYRAITVRSANKLIIANNTFDNLKDYAILVGNTGATVSNITINNNIFGTISGANYAVGVGGGTINGSSCVMLNNIGINTHQFPAWKTDNSVANGSTATSFNSATLPQSFPVGICMANINGDTGVPSTGGYQGTLTTVYSSYTSSKFIYQTYYPANNTTDLGSFYIRKADVSLNSWTSWYKVTGV